MKLFFRILGIISILYGIGVVLTVGLSQWVNLAFVFIGVFFLMISFAWNGFFREKRWARTLLAVLLIAAVCVVGAFEYAIIHFANRTPEAGADYVIVLGARVRDGRPSLEFGVRIRKAYEYAQADPGTKLVTTGGQGADEAFPEGVAAKDMLVSLGLPESRILVEQKSDSTYENLRLAKELIREDGKDPGTARVVIVSSKFHLYRASLHARAAGYGNADYLGTNGLFYLIPHYYLREFFAVLYETATGRFAQ